MSSLGDWSIATLGQIDAIGVDEIQYAKGHKYLTLVYQIDIGVTRLLWVGRERTIESFQGFFATMGQELISRISFICSDIWEPYLKVIQEKCSEALHILDRFHIVVKMNKALDEVRSEETRRMKREGRDPVLKKSPWLLLKRGEDLGDEQHFRLRDILRYNLKTVFGSGLIIGWLWLRTESIWIVAIAHGALNNWGQYAFKFMSGVGQLSDALVLASGGVSLVVVGVILLKTSEGRR